MSQTPSSDHVNLLFWTKDAANSYLSEYTEEEEGSTGSDRLFCDGGDADHSLTIGGNADLYALSWDEWQYLFTGRESAGTLYASVSLSDKCYCLAIAPDECANEYEFDYMKFSYTLEEYEVATKAGVVFLPAAGYNLLGYSVESLQTAGYYWTSSIPEEDEDCTAYPLIFDSINDKGPMGRGNGCSFRLVQKITATGR